MAGTHHANLIKVEDRLFKVPARNFITESEVFETMFKLPQNPDVKADGLSNNQPLRLEGVKSDDFRQLLRVMYPRYETDHRNAISAKSDITVALTDMRPSLRNNGYRYWRFPLNGI
jgi:hypothetical protein